MTIDCALFLPPWQNQAGVVLLGDDLFQCRLTSVMDGLQFLGGRSVFVEVGLHCLADYDRRDLLRKKKVERSGVLGAAW